MYYINQSQEVSFDQLKQVPAVPTCDINPSERWKPVHHHTLVDLVKDSVRSCGFNIHSEKYGIDKHRDMFAMLKLEREDYDNGTFRNVIGIRNSLCQKFRAGLVAGTSVMVCDNLAFFGEIATGHKNTQHIMDNLPGRIDGMMSQIQDNWKAQAQRYDTYADTELSESDAGKILWDAIDIDAISGSKSAKVINEYNHPRHDAFSPRNAWSLFNAFTEILKESPTMLQQRTSRLHNVFDNFCETKTPERLESLLSLPAPLPDEPLFSTGEPAMSDWS